MSSSIRSKRRVVAAAAGIGIALATLSGSATSFAASPPVPPTPAVVVPGAGVTVAFGTPVGFPEQTLRGQASVAAPNFTITDPGKIVSGSTVTVALDDPADTGATFDPTRQPVVTVSGTGVIASRPTVTANAITFVVSKSDDAASASYAVSGVYLTGPDDTTTGELDGTVSYTDATTEGTTTVRTFPFGAVTNLFPPVFGRNAAETSATLFRAAVPVADAPTSIVVATDRVPQDAESGSFLASAFGTGIVLTNSTNLSAAVSDVLADYPSIATVFIVGGTSVVSQNVENQLSLGTPAREVIRLAGASSLQTNQSVINYAIANGDPVATDVTIDYSDTRYNTTGGASSPTTTPITTGQTAIVASGSINSFQDGIASGALSYKDGIPLILTGPQGLDNGARQLLISGGYDQVILLGGPLAVSDAVYTQLTTSIDKGGAGVTAFRVAGSNAEATASLLASLETTDADGFGFATTDQGNGVGAEGGVLIARGTGFQDALAAGPYAGGLGNTPILLTASATELGSSISAYLRGVGADGVFSVQALGGPLAVTPAVQQAALAAEVAGIPATR